MQIKVPDAQDLCTATAFALALARSGDHDEYVIDFSDVHFTTPACLVVIGGALRNLKRNRVASKRRIVNYQHLTYAAHIGFFDHIGVKHGLSQGQAPGSETYLPMTEYRVEEVRRAALSAYSPVGEIIQAKAEELAKILTRGSSEDLQETIAYSLREIIRNVVEHSEAESYTLAAQYWPKKSTVEVVVSDQGMGLANSLRENPKLEIECDADALRKAILPGVSSKTWRSRRFDDDWANSGYGLFMVERLCALGGSFDLMSGDSLLRVSSAKQTMEEADWPGTVVVLTLKTENLGLLASHLSEFRKQGYELEKQRGGQPQGPSRASQSVKAPRRMNEE